MYSPAICRGAMVIFTSGTLFSRSTSASDMA